LGAYVDGELDVEERARIAEAAARDPEVARQIMVLSRLKSAVSALPDEVPMELPAIPARRHWISGIAAGLLSLMIGATAYWIFVQGNPSPGGKADLASIVHQTWSAAGQAQNIDRGAVLAAAPAHLLRSYVPDLQAAKLRLVYFEVLENEGGPALVAGYVGSRGCRVTIVVSENGGGGDILDIRVDGGLISARWRVGPLAYAILAKGMARQRFRLLAASVFEASMKAAPMSRRTQVALARSRAESKPCAIT
jgi:anti-sigma factor RsiW